MYKRIGDDMFDISRLLDINRPPLLKMKLIIVAALALVAVVAAAPQSQPEPPKILRSEFDQQPEGAYQFAFETEDGIVRNENGELKQALDEDNKPHDVIVVRGSYTYKDPTGQEITIHYTADETGFHAEGDSIPKAARK